jgi:retron-type reverse transcriptase
VKAFLKAGILTEAGLEQETGTGTPQGGILSPLLANIALSVLDEHLASKWATSSYRRAKRRQQGGANYRLVRYADLCRARHKSAYAVHRIMPSRPGGCLVRAVGGFLLSAYSAAVAGGLAVWSVSVIPPGGR